MMDYCNISTVFSQYSVLDALKVKHNIEYAIDALHIPSKELLQEMAQEGISIDEFEQSSPEVDTRDVTSSILRSHLKALFLDHQTLLQTLSGFSLSQRIEVRDYLFNLISLLKLPSPQLLEKLIQEGLYNPKHMPDHQRVLDVKTRLENAAKQNKQSQVDKINQIKAKLSQSKSVITDELKVARTKALLNKACDTEHTSLSDVKQRILS